MSDFIPIIISHGRPNNVYTVDTMRKYGYDGDFIILIDNEDKSQPEYRAKYGDKVKVFDKKAIAALVDNGDNFDNLRTTTHARNASFDIAKENGYRYFICLDDDYIDFSYTSNQKGEYIRANSKIKSLGEIFKLYVDFLKTTKVKSIAFSQGGDYIGGDSCKIWKEKITRKCMNSWFCDTENRFWFFSRLNEDVNTYINLGKKGHVFFTTRDARLEQKATQATSGGMTEAYIASGTYVKSFYSVMYEPSFVKCALMGNKVNRIHHRINWKTAVPCIIDEKHKK